MRVVLDTNILTEENILSDSHDAFCRMVAGL